MENEYLTLEEKIANIIEIGSSLENEGFSLEISYSYSYPIGKATYCGYFKDNDNLLYIYSDLSKNCNEGIYEESITELVDALYENIKLANNIRSERELEKHYNSVKDYINKTVKNNGKYFTVRLEPKDSSD
jgi:hypothetical protein